jgi:ABC-type sugar transport system permease subunit
MKKNTLSVKELFNKEELYVKDILVLFVETLSKMKLFFVFILFIALVLSLLKNSFTTIEYKSEASVYVNNENQDNKYSSLSNILGVDINQLKSNEINLIESGMFQEIIKSQAFLNELVITKIPKNRSGKDSITLEEYFENGNPKPYYKNIKNYILGGKNNNSQKSDLRVVNKYVYSQNDIIKDSLSPEMIFSSKVPPIVQLNSLRTQAINIVQSRIETKYSDKKFIVISKMPDPLLAAIVSKLILEKLIHYATIFKMQKKIENVNYAKKKLIEAETKYLNLIRKISFIKDNSFGVILQSPQSETQILNNELSLLSNLYNQASAQFEQSKFELEKETPMFSFLEPINYPASKSDPFFMNILTKNFIYSIVVMFFLIIIVLIYYYLYENK